MLLLSSYGFSVIYPRYRGTWESGGLFLERTPLQDIKEIIEHCLKGKVIDLYSKKEFKIKNKKIYLLGSSFGGTVALAGADIKQVRKICALSPIVDLERHNNENNEQDLFKLFQFIEIAFNEAYRLSQQGKDKLLSGKLLNPKQTLPKKISNKIMIFFDKSDTAVNWQKIVDYCDKNNLKCVKEKNVGHISWAKCDTKILKNIANFFME
jgi:esterase/lipase